MWKCKKCDREFKTTNQNHFCGKIYSIEAYIADQSEQVRPLLQQIHETIREAAPESTEKIAWGMPTFCQSIAGSQTENLIHFAAFKNHIGIYPGGEATTIFADRLKEYKTSKGAVQLPLNKPIDFTLITDIVKWRLKQI